MSYSTSHINTHSNNSSNNNIVICNNNNQVEYSSQGTESLPTLGPAPVGVEAAATMATGHFHPNRQQQQQKEGGSPKPGPDEEFTIRVLTLNCWGVWLGAKRRRQRMEGIVRYLRENNCDIVFLQEVWVTSDFEIIKNGTRDIYRFCHLFRSGSVLGSSGIVILCRWLPRVIHFEPYSLNGSPFYPWHGDWFAGKGIAYSRVDFDGLSLHLFSTHTHAYYKENEPVQDQYSVHRVCQSYQLARFITFIRDTACNRRGNGKDLMIVAGDMNSTSSELPYKILTTMAGLTDCFKASRYTNPSSNIIHRHKLLGYRRKTDSDSGKSSSNNSSGSASGGIGAGVSFLQNKFADNLLLETIEGYKNKIAQVLFDSDTDDEDITYCHPRNSFSPNFFNYKLQKNVTADGDNQQQQQKQQQQQVVKSVSHENLQGQQRKPLRTTKGGDEDDVDESNSLVVDCGKSNGSEHKVTSPASKTANKSINAVRQVTPDGSGASKSKRARNSPMKRIDFILCSLLTHGHCVVDKIDSESKDPSLDCSLSDHEPVMVELKICDISHDLMEKNRIASDGGSGGVGHNSSATHKRGSIEHSRPLASVVVDSKSNDDLADGDSEDQGDELEGSSTPRLRETTNQWVPERTPLNLTYERCNLQVMDETQELLMQYYQYNRASKTQLFYLALFMFVITLPTTTYYALSNELMPLSTIVFMWFAASFLFAVGLLIGFLSFRYEQGAIEATLNDIICRKSVARRHDENDKDDRTMIRGAGTPQLDHHF